MIAPRRKEKKMWLLIDDKRDLNCEVIARTAEAAKKLLSLNCWEVVCFDHDLGEKTNGYDILKWAIKEGCLPDKVQLVTSNPVGRERMTKVLSDNGYTFNYRIHTFIRNH